MMEKKAPKMKLKETLAHLQSQTQAKTKKKGLTHASEWVMSSKVAEADRYLKTQQRDNDTKEDTVIINNNPKT